MAISFLIRKSVWGISALGWLALWEPPLPAQTVASISVPLVGLIGSATEIRPIRGVIGASTVGNPISLPPGIGRVYLAPLQQWALVEQGSGGTIGRMPLNGSAPGTVAPIAGAMATAGLVSFSANGKNAILVSRPAGTLQVLTNLDTTPQVAMQSDISQITVAAAAISDDGVFPVVLTGTGAVYLLQSGNAPALLFRAGSPAGIGFLPNQAVLAIADGSAARITVLDGLASQPFPRLILPGPTLAAGPLLVQGSTDGNSVIVSASGEGAAYRADLTNQSLSATNLPARVSRLDRLNGNLFLFSANPGEAAWLLLADGASLRAGFAQSVSHPFVRNPVPRNPPGTP
jgi:hypothetical protein